MTAQHSTKRLNVLPPVQKIVGRGRLAVRMVTNRWRALPDFLIIGAQKAGTGFLHHYLTEHPAILSAAQKEIHYFTIHYGRGPGWYRAQFPLERLVHPAGHMTGEASPNYIYHPRAAERANDLVPSARIIAILRDPVSRATSHFFWEKF